MEWIEFLPPAAREMIKIGVIILIGFLAGLGVHLAGRAFERRLLKGIVAGERLLRLRTLLQAAVSLGQVIIAGIVILMILNEFQIPIAPILASAGVAGLALSLGAQTFIRDFFGGVLILVEACSP
jgi:small conductance mechanosensitive channel